MKPQYYSDVIVDALRDLGIEYISANIGATFREIWESLVNYSDSPVPIHAAHEEIAVGIADGYARAAHKPMAVLLHDLVGLQHATMAIYNSWCDRIPILLLGATGPMEISRRRPWIDWVHTANLPNNLIRDYVKWDDFAIHADDSEELMTRALNTAVAQPQGPSYLCFDSGYLGDSTKGERRKIDPELYRLGKPGEVPYQDMQRIAKLIVEAEFPVFMVQRTGRNPESVAALQEAAELTSGAVISIGRDVMNFPNTHPLNITGTSALSEADLIVALDAPELEKAITATDKTTRESRSILKPGCRIIRIGYEDLWLRSWSADYQRMVPSMVSISADTNAFLRSLPQHAGKLLSENRQNEQRIKERFNRIKHIHDEARNKWAHDAEKEYGKAPISLARLASGLWKAISGHEWVLVGSELYGWCHKLWSFERPDSYFGRSSGGGLGTVLPMSIGVALANKGTRKLVVDIQPDGDFLFSPSALWTAAHYEIPLLIVMFNNRAYYNDAEHNKLVATNRGRDERKAFSVGGDIVSPEVNYAQMAESYGVRSFGPVERQEDLDSVIAESVKYVANEGKPALVDVVCALR